MVACTIGFEWEPFRCAVEANHIKTNDKATLMNMLSVPWVGFHSSSSTFTHRLIKASSMSSDSHLLLTNAHVHLLSHSSDLLTLKLISIICTNIKCCMCIIHTTHATLNVNNQKEEWGSIDTRLTEYTIAPMLSMHILVIFSLAPMPKKCFDCTYEMAPFKMKSPSQ